MILFYVWEPGVDPLPVAEVPSRLDVQIWRPRLPRFAPPGVPRLQFGAWTAFHYLRVFANRECGAVIFREGGEVAHRSLVTPRYFRFPEMAARDLQIGATETSPRWRGRGLARAAVRTVCDEWAGRFARLWYMVDSENRASIRVIEACGFRLIGEGYRSSRLGLSAFGQYTISRHA